MRVKIDWRSASKENYSLFCKKHSSIKLTFDEWKNILYTFNEDFRNYILETGEKVKMPFGFGDFTIQKKKRKKLKGLNNEFINLPIDWKRTKEKGKRIYNFNFHTEGYFFGWLWNKYSGRIKNIDLWYFKPSRITSRSLSHYLSADNKYQHLYNEWSKASKNY